MELRDQAGVFMLTLLTGAGLAVLFDFYQVVRRGMRFRSALTFVGDFIYWVLATCIAFGMLLNSNGGEIRFYVFIGLLSGAALYYKLLSRFFIKNIKRMFVIMGVCINYLLLCWQYAVYRPLKYLLALLFLPFDFAGKTAKRINTMLRVFIARQK